MLLHPKTIYTEFCVKPENTMEANNNITLITPSSSPCNAECVFISRIKNYFEVFIRRGIYHIFNYIKLNTSLYLLVC